MNLRLLAHRDLVSLTESLLAAIRKHRDYRGDNRCWVDDEELYRVLPEGYTPPERDAVVELENCKKYITRRHNPRTRYVSPQRRIEELEEDVKRLCAENEKLRREIGSVGRM